MRERMGKGGKRGYGDRKIDGKNGKKGERGKKERGIRKGGEKGWRAQGRGERRRLITGNCPLVYGLRGFTRGRGRGGEALAANDTEARRKEG